MATALDTKSKTNALITPCASECMHGLASNARAVETEAIKAEEEIRNGALYVVVSYYQLMTWRGIRYGKAVLHYGRPYR